MKKILLIAALLYPAALCGAGLPELSGKFLNDYSGIINTADRTMMKKMMKRQLEKTGVKMNVLIIDSAGKYARRVGIVEFTEMVFRENFSPRKEVIFIVVAVSDRRMCVKLSEKFIENHGDSAEDRMTRSMIRFFKQDNYSKGIYEGLREVVIEKKEAGDIKEILKKHWKIPAAAGLIIVIAVSFLFAASGRKKKKKKINFDFGGGAAGKWN